LKVIDMSAITYTVAAAAGSTASEFYDDIYGRN